MKNSVVYIGQSRNWQARRMTTGLAGYGLGDAQIDAQNRVVHDIQTPYLDLYNATKGTPGFTPQFIAQIMSGIQQLITDYQQQYGGTSRGEAGRVSLQNFVDTNLFPDMRQQYANAQGSATATPVLINQGSSDPTGNSGSVNPFNGQPIAYPTTINISQPSMATPGNFAPSDTPGPPAGISIPGTEQTVNSPLAWYENPAILAVLGIAAIVMLGKSRQHA